MKNLTLLFALCMISPLLATDGAIKIEVERDEKYSYNLIGRLSYQVSEDFKNCLSYNMFWTHGMGSQPFRVDTNETLKTYGLLILSEPGQSSYPKAINKIIPYRKENAELYKIHIHLHDGTQCDIQPSYR
jgi:hypothetical protein